MKKIFLALVCFFFVYISCVKQEPHSTSDKATASAKDEHRMTNSSDSTLQSFDRSGPASYGSPSNAIFVLLDYSRSMKSIEDVAQRAYDLIISCPVGDTLIFLPVNNDVFTKAMFLYTRSPKPTKPKAIEKWKAEKKNSAQKVKDLILNVFRSKDENSCIVYGLKAVYNHVSNLPKGKPKLIVLSDMLECCKGFTCVDRPGDFRRLLLDIDKYQLDSCSLNQFISDRDITFVISSPDPKFQQIHSKEEYKPFWEAVARKMGYSKHWSFSPNLPNLQ